MSLGYIKDGEYVIAANVGNLEHQEKRIYTTIQFDNIVFGTEYTRTFELPKGMYLIETLVGGNSETVGGAECDGSGTYNYSNYGGANYAPGYVSSSWGHMTYGMIAQRWNGGNYTLVCRFGWPEEGKAAFAQFKFTKIF